MNGRTVQVDLRVLLPIAVLGVVVLAIIVTELCGREDVQPLTQVPPTGPTSTVGPTFTAGPSPTTGPEQATATQAASVGGEDRDQVRQQDLAEVQAALEAYHDDRGNYPDSNNNIQTLCVFQEVDIGCALSEFLDPLPQDPLGDPAGNGYFFQSDGERYALYAIRESGLLPPCDEHPVHLAQFESVICLRGPSAAPAPQP